MELQSPLKSVAVKLSDQAVGKKDTSLAETSAAASPLNDLSSAVDIESLSPEEQIGGAGSIIGDGNDTGPVFDPNTDRNVTVLVGRTAHLHCRVRYLGNRTVKKSKIYLHPV